MRLGLRLATGAALSLALFAGDISTLSLAAAPAAAAGFHGGGGGGFHGGGGGGFRGGGGGFRGGGGYGGYRGGYGGYHGGYYGGFGFGGYGYGGYYGGFGVGDALLGAALIGGTAAIIASNDRPYYDDYPTYQVAQPEYVPVAPAYGYAAPPPAQAYTSHDPVEQCSHAAVSEAAQRGDNGRIVSIDQVAPHENGARVIGTLEVSHNGSSKAPERARFTCSADYGQVTSFRFG